MNRGYSGYYKGVFLRSSYEYALAKYLDYHKLQWTYEEKSFLLDEGIYLPDFFIYYNSELSHVIEVKSNNRNEIKKAYMRLEELERKYGLKGRLVLYNNLKKLYSSLPFSLNEIIKSWVSSEKTSLNKSISGILNPHYGMSHSAKTKKEIGLKSKQRWSDEKSREYMISKLKESGPRISNKLKGRHKVCRDIRICLNCGNEFIALRTSDQKTCSQYCAGVMNFQKGNKIYVQNRNTIHKQIREFMVDWCKSNPLIVLNTPYNRIKTDLAPLFKLIEQNFSVKDLRVISKVVFGEDKGRKELLKFLKRNCL